MELIWGKVMEEKERAEKKKRDYGGERERERERRPFLGSETGIECYI